MKTQTPLCRWLCTGITLSVAILVGSPAVAQVFEFTNITDLPQGPGQGAFPSINDNGDVAFQRGSTVFLYDRDQGTFLNIHSLPGAPAEGRYPKLNNLGSIAFFETSTKDVWLFESAGQAFTNLSDLPGYPGASLAFDLKAVLALNNDNQISFHSGDRNSGDVYVYDHVAASFLNVSDQAGAPGRARENAINNAGQVCYMGFPDLYVYDMGTGTTTNITDLPGGPGTGLGSLVFNDGGDIAIFKPLTAIFFDSESATFLDLSTLPGFPPGAASTSTNDISNRGELTFWRDGIYYFEPISQTFTRLNGQGSVPGYGTAASINEASEIALAPGPLGAEDIFLAIPTRPLPPTNARIIR